MWCGGKIYLLVEFYHVAVKFYHHFSLNLGILEILLSLILRNIKHTHFSPKKINYHNLYDNYQIVNLLYYNLPEILPPLFRKCWNFGDKFKNI